MWFLFFLFFSCFAIPSSLSQSYRWQQRAEYVMDVSLDTKHHLLLGHQQVTYHNFSPDTLKTVYYHLYFNAFQPGSLMDVRSRSIADPDPRIGSRIASLSPTEIGYQRVLFFNQDGKPAFMEVLETILKVSLPTPLLPGGKSVFTLDFEAQIPIQIRRCGRDSKEGIAYSMTQWYPKVAEYDFQGWHAYPYIAREFHGVWGDFDVTLHVDTSYTVAATGLLQNPSTIGHNYASSTPPSGSVAKQHAWHFVAHNVIDFAWAADPDYVHDTIQVSNGPLVHFFYQQDDKKATHWKKLQPVAALLFEYLNTTFGEYPYPTYSIIQGGDGGMEYPMCTLIAHAHEFTSTIHTLAHEIAHSWYQSALASNESLYAWLDEGFAEFAGQEAFAHVMGVNSDHGACYESYFQAIRNGLYEAPATPSDCFITNRGYSTASYRAGCLFLCQLRYMVGSNAFYDGMRRYYHAWSGRHPEPNDFIRQMEKASNLQLHWFLRYWIESTKKIDYALDTIVTHTRQTTVTLRRNGDIPMPLEIEVTYANGKKKLHYVPLREMLGLKISQIGIDRVDHVAWDGVQPTYTLALPATEQIITIEIDPHHEIADIDRSNNIWQVGAPRLKKK